MRFSAIFQASLLAASAKASLVDIKVPKAVRKGESFAAFVHVQSGMSSGEVAYIWGEFANNLNSGDDQMGQILTVTDAKTLQLGVNQVRIPGLFLFSNGEVTLKVRVITYAGVAGTLDYFICQTNIQQGDRASSDFVTLDSSISCASPRSSRREAILNHQDRLESAGPSKMTAIESFDSIYLDLSKESGRCRFAETGFGWKPNGGGDTFTLDHNNISGAQWSKVAKGYEIRILQRNSGILQLDGFQQEDYDRLSKVFKNWYSTILENKEHALRGWNWGKAEFSKAEITFNVQNRPAFELPYAEIGNTNLAGRNEVAVEMSLPQDGNDTATANGKGKKAAAGKDQLVEMRFYVPGTTTKKEADGEDGEGSDGEQELEKNAATLFYETGRFDIDMYEASFRLRGKTYDYKIQYDAIKKFMVLPKPDEMHCMLCIGLDPPLRQGQTRYPFVVMQFKKDEEVTIDLNLDEATLESKYKDKLDAHYEEPLHHVVAKIFRGLANKKISSPAKDFITHRSQYGIKCSIKASEGFLYCLEKAFMFVPKPATYIAYEQTQSITFSRVGGAVSTLSTFDITVAMKGGAGSSQFSNINREDLKALETFFKLKGLRVKNEIDEDANLLAAALREQAMDDSEDEVVKGAAADRGSADEDEESVDEDFHAETESDISDPEASDESEAGSGSDAGESDVDDEDMEDEEERPKKKKKTA
ncbi:hypothetical protein LLEC1_00273 [Akanthomyces lecanii]|uniref:FACT complex subunit POB3 n=1 Tax=Cordyceps confragosa TaxID=2714763 RepID=A0A179I2I4_CORDF|nr:hypothetical protein LLEC1_00273 [Akanthomyces lecanii]